MSRRSRWAAVALALTTVLSAAGCGFDPASVPVPGAGVAGPTYAIHIEFADVLNLPARAKVMANGTQVGAVTGVHVVDPASGAGSGGYVVVDAEIQRSVALPDKTVAQLRQDTVLGDIHVELSTPSDGFATPLPAGGTIPRAQTAPATQVEDILTGIATFVQGGAITRFQDIVNRLNAVLPPDPADTARISQNVGANAMDLAAHLDAADALLNGLTADATVVDGMAPQTAELLTDPAVRQISDAVTSIVGVVGVLGALGGVAHSLVWLGPLVRSGDAAARAFVPLAFTARPLDLNAPSNLNALVALLRDRVIPFVERGPKVNVTGLEVEGAPVAMSTDDQVDSIIRTLRMIGAVR